MKSKIIKVLKILFAIVFSLATLGLIGYTAYENMTSKVAYQFEDTFFSIFIITLLCLISGALLSSVFHDHKQKKIAKVSAFSALFVFYCLLLINLLFTSRSYMYITPTSTGFFERISRNSNLIPFKTISSYLSNSDYYGNDIIITNIIGNILVLMPMGFFLPTYIKKLKKLLPFILSMFGGILIIEVIQVITSVGTFDVDDIILNLAGAVLAFFICKLRVIQKIEERIMK